MMLPVRRGLQPGAALSPLLATALLVALALAPPLAAQPPEPGSPEAAPSEPTPRQLLERIDDQYSGESSVSTMRMNIATDEYRRSLTMRTWSEGEDKSLVRILEPEREAGVSTLRVGEELWNYLPKVDRTIRVPAGMMSSAWMGSHFTNDDLVRETRFADDYRYRFLERPADNDEGVYVIEAAPAPDAPVVWGRVVLRVRPDGTPVDARYYDERDELTRTLTWSDVREVDGRRIPTRMRVEPADAPGEYTEIIIEDIDFDAEIPEGTFSLQSLRG